MVFFVTEVSQFPLQTPGVFLVNQAQGYKTFFMLNSSAESEIYPAVGILTFISRINDLLW